jgi:hypothetical protein
VKASQLTTLEPSGRIDANVPRQGSDVTFRQEGAVPTTQVVVLDTSISGCEGVPGGGSHDTSITGCVGGPTSMAKSASFVPHRDLVTQR